MTIPAEPIGSFPRPSVLAEEDLARTRQSLEIRSTELASSLALVRATLESTSDGILATDRQRRVTDFNQQYVRMWRLPEALLRTAHYLHPGEACSSQVVNSSEYLARLDAIYASSPSETSDFLELTDGRTFERISRIQFLDGRDIGRVWSYRDISDRRRADDELQRQSEWLRITLSSIGDGVVVVDRDGRVTYLNAVAEQLSGWPMANAAGQPLQDVFKIVDARSRVSIENPALLALRDGATYAMANHTILIGLDGDEHPIDDSAAPMRDRNGAIVGAVLIFRDISERQRANEVQVMLAAIVESSEDAIVSKDLNGIIRSWNRGAESLFGYSSEEAVGRSIALIVPSELISEEQMILRKLRHGERIEHFETVRVSKSGRRIDISLMISPIRDQEGRIIGASKIARDITALKQTQDALKDADRRKDEFLALLAHELRNPLAPLRNGLQVMRLAAGNAAAVEQARAMMDRQLGHMVRLVDDLLDLSRIGQNKMDLRRSRIHLKEAIDTAVETARPAIEAAGHELEVSMPDDPMPLHADLTRLAQVFSNLLTNSAKYTERNGRIQLTVQRRGDVVALSVSDNGIGIPREALPTVFDMFSQVDRSIERTTGGLGIGLALVKGFVEMHGGTVTAESGGLGLGSTFTVHLPIAESAAPPTTSVHGNRAGPGAAASARRILIVDDNEDAARSMAVILQLEGNEVLTARDGLEALDAVDSFRPHVILMDVGMPRMNGYEAVRRIREMPCGHEAVIVALTGWGQEGDRAQSRNAGCDAHLVKPVDLAELQRLLDGFSDKN